jgi:hypothetical protein
MTRRYTRVARWLIAVVPVVSAPTAGSAQQPVEFLKAVPDAPAFTFLGVTPAKVDRPGSLRDLGVALTSGVGQDGKAQEGFALDASLWNLIPGYDIPLAEYKGNRVKYAMANLQGSIATVRASGDSSDLMAAIGLRTVLYDGSDPLVDTAVTNGLARGLRDCPPSQPGQGPSLACVDSVTESVISEASKNWNAPLLAVAAAFGTRFENAEIDRSTSAGKDAWVVGAYGLGSSIQLLGQATYKDRPAVDTVPAYTAVNAAVRIIGGSPTFNAFAEWGREWRSADEDAGRPFVIDEEVGGWSAGLEFRLATNTWISTGVGTRFDAIASPDRTVVIANIKWGIASEARLANLR